MSIFDDHEYGMELMEDLFCERKTILEIRFTKGGANYVHRVAILKSDLSKQDISLLSDINTKDVFEAKILIKNLEKSMDRDTGLKNCITSNFRDANFYLNNRKYLLYKDIDHNGNMDNSVILTLKRVE